MINIKKETYQRIVAYIFFIFFTAPILSPYIYGFTVYIYWFIPFLDIDFTKMVMEKVKNKKIILIFLTILFFILNKIVLTVKIYTMITTVMYLCYAKKNRYFKILYNLMAINVIIAIIQFILIYINPNIAYLIGPTNIAEVVWGKYATPTFTNFYAIYLIPRVCGLSREAGFFASLLCTTAIVYILDQDIRKSKLILSIYFVGFILSFSKISIIYLPIIFILAMRNILNRIPIFIGSILFIILAIFISNNLLMNKYYNPANESITHRISGYTVMSKMNFKDLVNGVDSIKDINGMEEYGFVSVISEKYDEYTGIPNMIIHDGIITFIMFILGLKYMNIKFSGFLVLTFISFTTSYFTSTSHIVLGYFLVIYFREYLNYKGDLSI